MKNSVGKITITKHEMWAAQLGRKWKAPNNFGRFILRRYKKSCEDNIRYLKKMLKGAMDGNG